MRLAAVLVIAGCANIDASTIQSEDQIDQTIRDWMHSHSVVAMSVVISRDTSTVFSKGYGYIDLRRKTVTTPRSRFGIASITKQFTAAAALALLTTKGRSTDDRVTPTSTCKRGFGNVRYADLLDHTADYDGVGKVPDYDGMSQIGKLGPRLARFCQKLSGGSTFQYRNDNYLILSDAISRLAERPFSRVLAGQVIDPVSLPDTGFARKATDAVGYRCDPTPRPVVDTAGDTVGAGGLMSSAHDLERWNIAILSGRYPGTPGRLPFMGGARVDDTTRYQGGFEIYDDPQIGSIAMHDGMSPGYSAISVIFVRRAVSIAILTNCDQLDGLRDFANTLYGLVS